MTRTKIINHYLLLVALWASNYLPLYKKIREALGGPGSGEISHDLQANSCNLSRLVLLC